MPGIRARRSRGFRSARRAARCRCRRTSRAPPPRHLWPRRHRLVPQRDPQAEVLDVVETRGDEGDPGHRDPDLSPARASAAAPGLGSSDAGAGERNRVDQGVERSKTWIALASSITSSARQAARISLARSTEPASSKSMMLSPVTSSCSGLVTVPRTGRQQRRDRNDDQRQPSPAARPALKRVRQAVDRETLFGADVRACQLTSLGPAAPPACRRGSPVPGARWPGRRSRTTPRSRGGCRPRRRDRRLSPSRRWTASETDTCPCR